MELLPANLKRQLLMNNLHRDDDHIPVVKFFLPGTGATWIITDMDPDEDLLFGLCDLGLGEPELGYVNLSELRRVRTRLGLAVERDLHWHTDRPLSAWTSAARAARRILTPE